ncbi:Recombination protein RecR [hydrothermal vent metagenome]|uniref:Recombination protein RecR n=1 Tax=hydrothermal vent metagenome TaxID=652676 RepID=A0A3B1BSU8_9ZZZZ
MSFSPLIGQLIDALCCLPGVGPKSAQRMAFHLLQRDREGAKRLATGLLDSVERIGHCRQCRTLSEQSICELCASHKRDRSLLCVVESPIDVQAVLQAAEYKGMFFVLMGHLSPLDGIGPMDIGLDKLAARLDEGEIQEVILATNPTAEGEATAHYIAEIIESRTGIRATRIAHGVPVGGELEFVNSSTLSRAFNARTEV